MINITKDISWIGVLDFDIKTFDIVMETKFGTTYNSYFINADKKAIIETAKETFKETYLNKIKQVVNPEEIEYIILNHTEPDHSGSLKHLLKIATNATVVGSGNAIRYLNDMVGFEFKSLIVKDGDSLSLGNKTLKFISAPNLHWPDSIYTYIEEDNILFTCDSFGAHYCSEEIFDADTNDYYEAFKYYFDVILKPYSKFFLKAIEKISCLKIFAVCPAHGPVLKNNCNKIVNLSKQYCEDYLKITNPEIKKVFIAYVSSYGFTKKMAELIAEGIKENANIEVNILDIEKTGLDIIDSHISQSCGLIIGCPTINQNILLPVYSLFAVINPIRDRGKFAAAFGSYGWSGEGVKIIEDTLSNLKLNVLRESMNEKFYPYNSEKFKSFGKVFGEKIVQSSNIQA